MASYIPGAAVVTLKMVRFLLFYCETDAFASICFPGRGALPFKQNISSKDLKL